VRAAGDQVVAAQPGQGRRYQAEPARVGLKDLADLIPRWSGKVAVDYGHELVNIKRLGDRLDGSVGEQFVDDVA